MAGQRKVAQAAGRRPVGDVGRQLPVVAPAIVEPFSEQGCLRVEDGDGDGLSLGVSESIARSAGADEQGSACKWQLGLPQRVQRLSKVPRRKKPNLPESATRARSRAAPSAEADRPESTGGTEAGWRERPIRWTSRRPTHPSGVGVSPLAPYSDVSSPPRTRQAPDPRGAAAHRQRGRLP